MVTTRIGEHNHPRPSVSTLYRCIPIPLRQWLSSTLRAVKQLKHSPLLLLALAPTLQEPPLCGLVRTWRLDSLRRLWHLTFRSFLLFFVAIMSCCIGQGRPPTREHYTTTPRLSFFLFLHSSSSTLRTNHPWAFFSLAARHGEVVSLSATELFISACLCITFHWREFFFFLIGMVPEGLISLVGCFSCQDKLELYKSF